MVDNVMSLVTTRCVTYLSQWQVCQNIAPISCSSVLGSASTDSTHTLWCFARMSAQFIRQFKRCSIQQIHQLADIYRDVHTKTLVSQEQPSSPQPEKTTGLVYPPFFGALELCLHDKYYRILVSLPELILHHLDIQARKITIMI